MHRSSETIGAIAAALAKAQGELSNPEKSLSAAIDRDSTQKILDAIEEHGLPDLQVVYFPGVDIFTHAAQNPLESQTRYLEHVTDGAVGRILEAYSKAGALDNTYVIFISDHGHIPTIPDERHQLVHPWTGPQGYCMPNTDWDS